MTMGEYFIKVRFPGRKVYDFVGSGGTTSRLRIYALMFRTAEDVQRAARTVADANPELEVVALHHQRRLLHITPKTTAA